MSLFADDMSVYIENAKDSTNKVQQVCRVQNLHTNANSISAYMQKMKFKTQYRLQLLQRKGNT